MSRATMRSDKELEDMDSVKYARLERGDRRAMDILLEAQKYWDSMSHFRKDRERNKRYVYGDQWGDMIPVGEQCGETREYSFEEQPHEAHHKEWVGCVSLAR